MRRLLLAAVMVTACLFLPGGTRAGEEAMAEKARVLLDYQAFARGDRDGSVRFNISASREMLGTPLAELAVRTALMYSPADLSAVAVGEVEARRILSAEPELSAEHRDLLRRFVARSFAAAGRREDAMEVHRRRGLAMSWLKAGPYPGHGGLENWQPPSAESATPEDVAANPPDGETFRQWRRNPPWRHIPENRSFPFLRPWSNAAEGVDGRMVLFTSFTTDSADNNAFFHVFADTSWSLYIDGQLLSDTDRNVREIPLEHMVPHILAPGRHTVVVLLQPPAPGVKPAEARFALRLETTGAFSWDASAAEPEAVKTVATRRDPRPIRFLTELRRSVGDNPGLMGVLAMACVEQGMPDIGAWWAEKAVTAAPDDPILLFLAAWTAEQNQLLPPGQRRDIARERHLQALAAKPDLVPSLVHLARAAIREGMGREAAGYLRRAREVNPASIDILLARSEWAARFASVRRVREIMDEGAETYPASPAVQIAVSNLPREGFLDMDRRLAAARAALEAGPYVPETSLNLAGALAESGNAEEAEGVLQNARELFAGDAAVLQGIATIYARAERLDEARRVLADALAITPDDAAVWRLLGDYCMAAGEQEEALTYWQASLAGNPGQFALRDMMQAIGGVPASQLHMEGGHDAIAITAAGSREEYAGDVVRLLDRTVLDFASDGSYRRLTHEIDMALTREGGESLTGIAGDGERLTTRIVFPNGNTLEPEPYPGQDGLRLPVIMPGAAREMRVLESVPAGPGAPPIRPWYFQDPQGRMQLVRSEYVVRVPRDFPLVYAERNVGSGIRVEISREDDKDVYRWATDSLDIPVREPDAVDIEERVPSVEVGIRTTWDDIVAAELRRLDGRLMPSMRMRQLLQSLRQPAEDGRPNPLQVAKSVYRFVCDAIDPSPGFDLAAHIHAERKGDRTILLLSLLRAAGLEAHPARARQSDAFTHPPTWELPNRDFFTLPLVRLAIPGGDTVWLDTRFDSLPFGAVADDLSGAMVLTFLPSGPLFETLALQPIAASRQLREKTILLPGKEEEKEVSVSGRNVWRGVLGLERGREVNAADAEGRRNLLLAGVYPIFPDAVLNIVEAQSSEESDGATLERYELTARSPLEERRDGVMAVSLCLSRPRVISDRTRTLTTRSMTAHIAANHVTEDRNVFRLPPGGRFVRLPEAVDIPSSYGVYQLRVFRRGNDEVEVVRSVTIPAQRISPLDWPGFLKFLERVDMAETQWLEYTAAP